MAKVLSHNVQRGVLTDCEALALFARGSVNASGGDMLAFVQSFGVFVPSSHTMLKLASFANYHIESTSSPEYLAPGGGDSGFREGYQDIVGWEDQSHHFAAYFQFGYQAGSTIATLAAYITEQNPWNRADIALGIFAAELGAQLSSGKLTMSDIGNRISSLCK
jgi:hypothetical protein